MVSGGALGGGPPRREAQWLRAASSKLLQLMHATATAGAERGGVRGCGHAEETRPPPLPLPLPLTVASDDDRWRAQLGFVWIGGRGWDERG